MGFFVLVDGVFGRFKILLPNLIISLGLGITVIIGWIFLPKDEIKKDPETDPLIKKTLFCKMKGRLKIIRFANRIHIKY